MPENSVGIPEETMRLFASKILECPKVVCKICRKLPSKSLHCTQMVQTI